MSVIFQTVTPTHTPSTPPPINKGVYHELNPSPKVLFLNKMLLVIQLNISLNRWTQMYLTSYQ